MTFTLKEWVGKSKKGEVCGVVGCDQKPTNKCTKCSNHYCYGHVKTHFHIETTKDTQDWKNWTEKLR